MSKRFARGLVVGKFCPLHRGHELVIGAAGSACERVLVLSYTKPEFDGLGAPVRRRWLSSLFPGLDNWVLDDDLVRAWGLVVPENDAPERVHRDFVAQVSAIVCAEKIDAVFTSEDYGAPFAAHLAAWQAHAVEHVAVDPARSTVPISGTALRAGVLNQRQWLSPVVERSLVTRVALLGAESTGKTTLAGELARSHGCEFVAEYGRERWLERGGDLDESDLLGIATEQVRREEAAIPSAKRLLICDTSPFTTAVYSQLWYGRVEPELERLAARRYQLLVLCEPDFPFEQDGTRVSEEFQRRQHAFTLQELERRRLQPTVVRGSIAERVRQVNAALARLWNDE